MAKIAIVIAVLVLVSGCSVVQICLGTCDVVAKESHDETAQDVQGRK